MQRDTYCKLGTNFAFSVLALVAPLINFLKFNHAEFIRPEIGIIVLVIGLVAIPAALILALQGTVLRVATGAVLLIVSADLLGLEGIELAIAIPSLFALAWLARNDRSRIFGIVLAVMCLVSLVLPATQDKTSTSFTGSDDKPDAALPVWIHIVLDAHIGIEGFPTEIEGASSLGDELVNAYTAYGFRGFGGAYSLYDLTWNSVGNLVNFSVEDIDLSHFEGREYPYRLIRNGYFDILNESGYKTHVYQTRFLDYCWNRITEILTCDNIDLNLFPKMQSAEISALDKSWVIATRFVRLSSFYHRFLSVYADYIYPGMQRFGVHVPVPNSWEPSGPPRQSHINVFDDLIDRIRKNPRGHAYFAHLLLPHDPYVLDSECRLDSASSWRGRSKPGAVYPSANDKDSREASYRRYLEQVSCVQKRLFELFEFMRDADLLDDAVIIVHGDHGSRLALTLLTAATRSRLTTRDFVDYYSSFLAIKAPGFEPGYEAAAVPLDVPFSRIFGRDAASQESSTDAFVFLRNEPFGPMEKTIIPAEKFFSVK